MNTIIQTCEIPVTGSETALLLAVEAGRSIIIIGANGAGKTRLGVHLENGMGNAVQRVAAQKSLTLNDRVQLTSLERAESTLRFGTENGKAGHKLGQRWGNRPALHLLNDFDSLLQTLFADHSRIASEHLKRCKIIRDAPVPVTKLEKIKEIWDKLLPHRILDISEATIKVRPVGDGAESYSGSEMSDGERAIFYFLGQSFVATPNSALIIDEPEGHIHKAIVGPLWDAIEKARPDCGFIYITHDLDFAVTRPSAEKYVVRSYNPERKKPQAAESWEMAQLPEDTGLPEHVVAELVGNRRRGKPGRDDLPSRLRRVHRDADRVLRGGGAFGRQLQRECCTTSRGREGHGRCRRPAGERVRALKAAGVLVLPVAEVENLLLLPAVFTTLAEALQCDPAAKLAALTSAVMETALGEIEAASARYATRQLDRRLKKVTVKAKELPSLQAAYAAELATIDPAALYAAFKQRLEAFVAASDLAGVLKIYDNKGLLALAATTLDLKGPKPLLERVSRLLGNDAGKQLSTALSNVLPKIIP
jgi:hypothetical protein